MAKKLQRVNNTIPVQRKSTDPRFVKVSAEQIDKLKKAHGKKPKKK